MFGFNTDLTSSPGSSDIGVFVEGGSEVSDEGVEVAGVFLSDFGEDDGGGGLLVDESSESFLIFNETVGDVHLSAKLG